MGWETCKGTGTGWGTHQQRCDLVQDIDDFTCGLALIDFWCRRHGWGCNGVDRDAEFGGFTRVESPADANRCKQMQTPGTGIFILGHL